MTFSADQSFGSTSKVVSAVDLKAGGTFRYVADASTSAIVLAYAIGDAPALTWHDNGAILDWDNAPSDLRAAFERGASIRRLERELRQRGLELRARWGFPSSSPSASSM